ncbi:hypothetical protein EYC80_002592 [Monilinia laxa]|uniref:Transmembrane protein n=1 Tax=Monilinia laxa TaxID=61186 RepID=A0A5N6K4F9_MONLA|nr:hypothetical protein EYC80_002592 [Monilinia laxa]
MVLLWMEFYGWGILFILPTYGLIYEMNEWAGAFKSSSNYWSVDVHEMRELEEMFMWTGHVKKGEVESGRFKLWVWGRGADGMTWYGMGGGRRK